MIQDISHAKAYSRSVGAGFLSTTVPHILDIVGTTIYNSCTKQEDIVIEDALQ